jgi:protein TonB
MRDPFLAEALSGYEKHAGRHARAIRQLQRKVEAQARRTTGFRWSTLAGLAPTIPVFSRREWLEMIFAGRHRAYGAYVIRRYSSRRHLLAYVITVGVETIALLLPTVVQLLQPAPQEEWLAITTLSDIRMEIHDESSVVYSEMPPPPPLKSTIRFTVMQVVEDEQIVEEEAMRTQEELIQASEAISIADIVGVGEAEGIDIADLEEYKVITEAVEDIFLVGSVEQNPEFPGGMEALYKWINRELRYPATAQEMGIVGRVMVQFVVGSDGEIRDVILLRGVEPSLDKEALRVVAKMPKWVPGKQGGRTVAVRYVLPIVYKL